MSFNFSRFVIRRIPLFKFPLVGIISDYMPINVNKRGIRAYFRNEFIDCLSRFFVISAPGVHINRMLLFTFEIMLPILIARWLGLELY